MEQCEKMEIDLESDSFFGEQKDWGGKELDQTQMKETRIQFFAEDFKIIRNFKKMRLNEHWTEMFEYDEMAAEFHITNSMIEEKLTIRCVDYSQVQLWTKSFTVPKEINPEKIRVYVGRCKIIITGDLNEEPFWLSNQLQEKIVENDEQHPVSRKRKLSTTEIDDPNKNFTMEIEDSCPFSQFTQPTQYSFDLNETKERFNESPDFCSTQKQSQQLFFT